MPTLDGEEFEDEPERECSRCHESFPADEEFFYKHSGRKDKLHGWCKVCVDEVRRVKRSNITITLQSSLR